MHYTNNFLFFPAPPFIGANRAFCAHFYTFYNHYQVCYTLRGILQKNTRIDVVSIFWDKCHLKLSGESFINISYIMAKCTTMKTMSTLVLVGCKFMPAITWNEVSTHLIAV